MNLYEIAVLYDPHLEVDLSKAEKKVKKIISDNEGKIVKTDNWGKKKLAYQIAKHDHAIYVFYDVEMPGINLGKVESALNITDEVIRYLVTRPDLKAIEKAKVEQAEKAKKAAERGDRADDEDDEEDSRE